MRILLLHFSDIDECKTSATYKNGATCVNTIGGYQCHCSSGYKEQNCDQETFTFLYFRDIYLQPLNRIKSKYHVTTVLKPANYKVGAFKYGVKGGS